MWGTSNVISCPSTPSTSNSVGWVHQEEALRVSAMIDGNGLELGRVTWLRRGWPDLFEELAQMLPRLREFV